MSLTWESLHEKIQQVDADAVATQLVEATEPQRQALARDVEAGVRAMKPEDRWREPAPAGVYALAALGTMPSAARAAALLNRRDLRDSWGSVPLPPALRVIRARELPWLGALATRLAPRLNAEEAWRGGWGFVAALLVESGATLPASEGVVGSWIVSLQYGGSARRDPFVDRLRESPYLDALLPGVFEFDGLGAHLTLTVWDMESGTWTGKPAFPAAVAQLVAEGRLDRKTILAATVDRLVRGDRPAFLRPFALLHDELAPTTDEMAGHTLDYAQLLPGAPSAIAGIAQRALRAVDDAGRLDLDTLLDASRATLVRKEKTLVKAQLTWLDRVARRDRSRAGEVLETVAAAFDHPALDIQERALTLIEKRSHGIDLSWLAGAIGGLGADLPARAARLTGVESAPAVVPDRVFAAPPSPAAYDQALAPPPGSATSGQALAPPSGSAAPDQVFAGPSGLAASGQALAAPTASHHGALAADQALAAPPGPAAMPAAIGSVAELATEVVALLARQSSVGWERVLAGLVALRAADDLSPVTGLLDRHSTSFGNQQFMPRHHALAAAIRAVAGEPTPRELGLGTWPRLVRALRLRWRGGEAEAPQLNGPPERLMTLRIVEIAALLREAPVPELVSTPTHVDGNLDAPVLVERLRRAEAEGWEPWPLDFEQALLRLPRGTSPTVADGLTSAAGRRLAEWLAEGGLPDPVGSVFEQRQGESGSYYHGHTPEKGRLVVNLTPARPGRLSIEEQLVTLKRRPTLNHDDGLWSVFPDILFATLPHHREVCAAWLLPLAAALADVDERGGFPLLPPLAETGGPFGPATSLAVAYALNARHEPDRVAAVDAFLILAAREPDTRFATSIGHDLGRLGAKGMVKVNRSVMALADAHRAGASAAVWRVLAAALPALLPAEPRGLPDLLELASQVAPATGARDEIEGLTELAARKGSTRVLKEARRLRTVLTS
ncbi:hypothetical protein JIG36_32655 [Actinoplanes sp. LDG1-06]|uniref:Secreted protein n=1 Tax=Paractinoplanes ovalisporus TaxID=2810368 RepID=A0ABS2AKD5_9ACTN|nr:DUF6493 family protein [Actinoplanes ovalisporus]MBM2620276.1 hypothetical protein [Actinoplanes ovalisporus]